MSETPQYITIDLDAVLRSKLPGHYRWIPRWLIRALERSVCQDRLNELLRSNAGRRGADFCRGVLSDLDITYSVTGEKNLPADSRVIIVSNHPLGGLDGLILIDCFTRIYGREVRFLVNDLLMAVEPLSDVFMPINKHGRQSRTGIATIDAVLASDMPVIIFPAGLCSRRGKGGKVADLEWQKMFVNKAIESRRTVIPVRFSGENSKFFYKFAKWRKRIGIKLNIEMIRLPKEMLRASGSSFSLTIGRPIGWETLQGGRYAREEACAIRNTVYSLP